MRNWSHVTTAYKLMLLHELISV